MKKIKVLIVDDSPVFRALLTQLIDSDPALQVVASAKDPYQARELIKHYQPDVVTLDVEMPKMNGVQFLKNLMRLHPLPVVMISTLTQHGAEATLAALELGAVDYFPKPSSDNPAEMLNYKNLVNDKIKMAAQANVGFVQSATVSAPITERVSTDYQLIAIGSSTGGTEAVKQVLAALPSGLPPIVMTQHIGAQFTASLAKRLNDSSALHVQEVTQPTTALESSCAYLAPGDKHIVVVKRAGKLYVELDDRPAVNRHKPSVDVMFDSIAQHVGSKAMGILLTGMGQDGAKGMLAMHQQGAATAAQDEQSSVVWGMPRVAIELGAADVIKPLGAMATWIIEQLQKKHA
ncbi:chemotaxis response regulator protein-glutamate methylesterase [Vibrio cholerae]|uniref:protein-glutamate methylesterase/protein-glutamine glutaminase n=1 Tax=Vibrio cholerae TaxID=666 RepID=UPI0018F0B245|nr:chemotaxis response regulator protein-glutamate methylesterase [Vibrio cholerae]EGQ9108317.1 chemotaxis-specific protein-glutamate methyltransferase CheB [Vibrio cholerae]MBJ6956567.1 chemotaxis response regulator protein-glutamate methylesterase [Vibrio cholerae]MBJ6960887.1 chemotaxis response regulator protein-glutamate methylesterase [Vibrio cholerae]MBY4643196.1 chemotaxis response regulator protein-glutamate methylesterase [Vibrio cholerae]MCR9658986.1 chemotaxis response regulator pr